MLSPCLPVEVIDMIISNIDEYDSSTLLNVSLINKKWCLIGILHLWRYPFIKTNSKARFKAHSKIITTLLSHLDQKTQSFLKINGLFDIPHQTTFNYPSFIKQIDFVILRKLIWFWLEENKFSSNSINQENQEIDYKNNNLLSYDYGKLQEGFQLNIEILIFFEILYKLIVAKTLGIDILQIVSFAHEFPLGYLHTLIDNEETRRCLSRLKQFKCKGNFAKGPLINLVTEISREISTFSLSLSNIYDQDLKINHVSNLLKNQKNLKRLNIKSNDLITSKYIMEVKKRSLREIKLSESESELDFMLNELLKCPNLKRICFCGSNLYRSKNLGKVVFPNLTGLEIIDCNFLLSDELPSPIIKFLINNGRNLMSIRISDSQLHKFLLKIPLYCSNLVSLSVDIRVRKISYSS
ncbi:hypothetical protein RclHR1_00040002 [Rhizophagus clarus]|uniref:F-box domain-containing protein n=1 Tax=Rhizophagus clarus TaxID=94130 RepID=A0A2Z6RFZ7_9GLOM|nr:hypothetical protein RclHR1_00040002 [Rhizophagus clarus]